MSTISKPHTFSPNTTISSSQVNADFDTLYNDYNGNIDASNLATSAVSTAKIADSAVTTAKIADSNITAAKINFGGAGAGIWWEEIGRTTVTVAGDTITVSSLPARKYLHVIFNLFATGGTVSAAITFNGDTATNYAYRIATNDAADATAASTSSLVYSYAAVALPQFGSFDVMNLANQEKNTDGRVNTTNTAGAGTVSARKLFVGKWANTSDQISSITFTNTGTGDYAIGSEVVVLGHD